MELAYIVLSQVIVIFILISIGYILCKKEVLTDTGISQITSILLNVVTPCVLVNSYQKEFNKELISGLIVAMIMAVIIHIIAILLSTFVFTYIYKQERQINIFSSIYSNCGFMAIPLLTAALGSDGVFYGSAYLVVFTILAWTHGLVLFSGDKSIMSIKKIITNPGIAGTVIALILFVFGIKLPSPLKNAIEYMSYLNTPLAMIVLGSFLVKINLKKVFKMVSIYVACLMRLIIIPLILVVILKFIKTDPTVASAIVITSACPSATIATLFSTRFGLNADYASGLISFSTILSILTIPLMVLLHSIL